MTWTVTRRLHANPTGLVLDACSHLARWMDRARQRRFLAQLPERELRDIGISRYDALQEWRKPFWKG
jgi:uncharacterized protein YjiS (DUF1127 family)